MDMEKPELSQKRITNKTKSFQRYLYDENEKL